MNGLNGRGRQLSPTARRTGPTARRAVERVQAPPRPALIAATQARGHLPRRTVGPRIVRLSLPVKERLMATEARALRDSLACERNSLRQRRELGVPCNWAR